MRRFVYSAPAAFATFIVATCCYGLPFNPSTAVDGQAANAGVRRFVLDTGENTGLSDLTIDSSGHFWSAPERQRVILRLNMTREHPGVDDAPIPLEGVPDGYDTESITWVSDGQFFVGTETNAWQRSVDKIFSVAVEGGRAHVTGHIDFPYKLWDMTAHSNNGLEGVCYAGGHLFAASETASKTEAGQRFAPFARYDFGTKQWTPFHLNLTSTIGKISSLNCRVDAAHKRVEFVAIERHFGVSHLLHFTVADGDTGGEIKPEVLVDFGRVIDAVPNFEGVSWSPQGDLLLISDNDMGFVTGPTQGLFLPRDWRP